MPRKCLLFLPISEPRNLPIFGFTGLAVLNKEPVIAVNKNLMKVLLFLVTDQNVRLMTMSVRFNGGRLKLVLKLSAIMEKTSGPNFSNSR